MLYVATITGTILKRETIPFCSSKHRRTLLSVNACSYAEYNRKVARVLLWDILVNMKLTLSMIVKMVNYVTVSSCKLRERVCYSVAPCVEIVYTSTHSENNISPL